MESDVKRDLTRLIYSAPDDRRAWLAGNTKQPGIRRGVVAEIQASLDKFQVGELANRWFILPGLRGVGKTTVLTQLYLDLQVSKSRKFFLSLERVRLLGAKMQDVLDVLEEILGESFETLKDPVYIFMDEVHYLDNWALGLKVLFDRAPKAFITCTGSSAIDLQTNPDIARRSLTISIYPLDFVEYVAFQRHYGDQPPPALPAGLREEIGRALIRSDSCQDAFSRLLELKPDVTRYWQGLDKKSCLEDYLRFGNLPFTFQLSSDAVKWRAVDSLLSESLAKDIDQPSKRRGVVAASFPLLLNLLAESDIISLHRITKIAGFDKRTVMGMLGDLCRTEILNPIRPLGSAYRRINRPVKYLFTSPAVRLSLGIKAGMPAERSGISGRLLEDMAGLYLKRISPWEGLCYDSKAGGADFAIFDSGLDGTIIPIEIGWNKRNGEQVGRTLQSVKGKYGLVVTNAQLEIHPTAKTVFVPLEYFLLA